MTPGSRLALSALPAAIITLLLVAFMQSLIAERPDRGAAATGTHGIRFGTVELPKPPVPPEPVTIEPPPSKPSPPDAHGIRENIRGSHSVSFGAPDAPPLPPFVLPDPRSSSPLGYGAAPGSGLMPVTRVAPIYPTEAVVAGIEGWVEVEFTVRIDGSTADVRILDAQPRNVFNRSAVAAVQRWRFRPPVVDGVPREARTRQRIDFVLPD
jgi:periplasmic protein TonB